MIYSGDSKRAIAMREADGAFVDINLNPPEGVAHLKVWGGTAGPILRKTIHKRNADYRAAIKLHAKMWARVPKIEVPGMILTLYGEMLDTNAIWRAAPRVWEFI